MRMNGKKRKRVMIRMINKTLLDSWNITNLRKILSTFRNMLLISQFQNMFFISLFWNMFLISLFWNMFLISLFWNMLLISLFWNTDPPT